MKITRIESMVVALPQLAPAALGGGRLAPREVLLLRVDTDAGLSGWGEGFGYAAVSATRSALETAIAPLAVGREAAPIAPLLQELAHRLHNLGRSGPVVFGLSALDIALWDLAGKAAGVPLQRLLGGGGRSTIPAYASLNRVGDPEAAARVAAEAAGRGYRHVKLHERSAEAAVAARAAVGPDVELMLDANCPWTRAQALDMARGLGPAELLWLEEPLWPPEDAEGLAWLAQRGGIPLAAGENATTPRDFRALLESGALAYLQPSATKIGGLSGLRQAAALAESFGVCVVPHSPGFGPGLLATLHFLAAAPGPALVEHLYCELDPDLYSGLTRPQNGQLRIPDGPGLGADPDPAVIARHRIV